MRSRRQMVQRCANPNCDFYERPNGESGRSSRADEYVLRLIPQEIRERYANETIWQCGYCDALFVGDFRFIGKIGRGDGGVEEFWRRGETKLQP